MFLAPKNSSGFYLELGEILKLFTVTKNFFKFQAGDGSHISLWMDAWHPDGVLFDKYGFRVVYDACSNIEAKLSSVINDGDWNWFPARCDDLVSI